jgi:NADH-quinone oxidoreductase subunit L
MGGLAKVKELQTAKWGFLLGGLALAGIFPLAGYFSKEEILTAVHHDGVTQALAWGAFLTAAITAYYVLRAYILVFWGNNEHEHPHPATASMNGACWVLTLLTVVSGAYLGWPAHPVLESYLHAVPVHSELTTGLILMLVTALPGFYIAYSMFAKTRPEGPAQGAVFRWAGLGWAADEVQRVVVIRPLQVLGQLFGGSIENAASHSLPDRVADAAVRSGAELGLMQNGLLRTYALVLLTGLMAALVYLVWQVQG